MSISVLLPIANGSEEIETVTIANVLRRADIHVTLSSVESTLTIKGSRGIQLVADELITESETKSFDLIAIPGGLPGAERLRDNCILTRMLHQQNEQKKYIAAICASPVLVLEHHGLLQNKKACCYPCFKLKNCDASKDPAVSVVVCENIITATGPGTAMQFSLKLIECLKNSQEAYKVAQALLFTGAF